jgi:hypothetical protein
MRRRPLLLPCPQAGGTRCRPPLSACIGAALRSRPLSNYIEEKRMSRAANSSAKQRPWPLSLVAVLAGLLLLAAACGSDDDETSADAPASDDAADTTAPEDVPEGEGDGEETLNTITAIVDGNGETFNNNVDCVLGPDDSGSIKGTADDGSTISATLDGTASKVVIDGPFGSYDAPFTSVSNDQATMTITAAPPDIEVLVVTSSCTED